MGRVRYGGCRMGGVSVWGWAYAVNHHYRPLSFDIAELTLQVRELWGSSMGEG
jgi:hypothetical protein